MKNEKKNKIHTITVNAFSALKIHIKGYHIL